MRTADFAVGQSYVYHYPYVTTPCFIFNLDESADRAQTLKTQDGERYTWEGGVGPKRSIVSYSAICAHQMTYPAKSASFLNYRHAKVDFVNNSNSRQTQDKIIYCCSERSVYDAKKGAKVIGGPAPQPLAAILIEYVPAEDHYYAVGTHGGELFEKFFTQFEFRLQLDFRIVDVSERVQDRAEVLTIEEFSDAVVRC